jgi:hypothetical protein
MGHGSSQCATPGCDLRSSYFRQFRLPFYALFMPCNIPFKSKGMINPKVVQNHSIWKSSRDPLSPSDQWLSQAQYLRSSGESEIKVSRRKPYSGEEGRNQGHHRDCLGHESAFSDRSSCFPWLITSCTPSVLIEILTNNGRNTRTSLVPLL